MRHQQVACHQVEQQSGILVARQGLCYATFAFLQGVCADVQAVEIVLRPTLQRSRHRGPRLGTMGR